MTSCQKDNKYNVGVATISINNYIQSTNIESAIK